MTKYYLSIGVLFKNESLILKEWLDHHIFHGVDHFYLINDNSNDNFLEILNPYIENDIVELFNIDYEYFLGRQRCIYNNILLPRLKESKWLFICDMDEFLWSQQSVDLKNVLIKCHDLAQIQVNHTIFGSNNLIEQPKYVIPNFTKRSKEQPTKTLKNTKYFVNSDYEFTSLNVHHANFLNKEYESGIYFRMLDKPYFLLNHYSCQSFEFWKNIKCTREDVDNYRTRTPEVIYELDINEVEDKELYEQNISLYD